MRGIEQTDRQRRVGALGVLLLLLGSFPANANPFSDWLRSFFHPPEVEMKEAYAPRPEGPSFDHSLYDSLLREHVAEGGWVDYEGLDADRSRLQDYLDALADAPFDALGRDEKLTLLLNAYNAFTLELILDFGIPSSIRDIPSEKRWEAERWQVGPHTWSLDQIEHEQIRPKFVDARIHFALVCAAVGCAPLRAEAYRADRVDAQLEDQTKTVHSKDAWFELWEAKDVVRLTRYYEWYQGDFAQVAGGILEYAARHVPALEQRLDEGRRPRIEWIEYDWSLNSVENRRPR